MSPAALWHAFQLRIGMGALFLLMASVWPLLLLLSLRDRTVGMVSLMLPLYATAVTAAMFLFFAFTYRVELPFEVAFGFGSLAMAATFLDREPAVARGLRVGGMLTALAVSGYGLYGLLVHQYRVHQSVMLVAERTQQMLGTLNRDFAGSVILIEPKAGLPLESLNPLQVAHLEFTPIQLGWSTFSPRFYQQIGALGIQHGYQLVDALITHEHAYMLGSKTWCRQLLPYATLPGAAGLQPVLVRQLTPRTAIYRFQEQK